MGILYRPADGVAGDFIPFHWKGDYHLFYIKAYRDEADHGPGRPWFHLVTRDFVDFEDWGVAFPAGSPGEQDVTVGTGSVVPFEDMFYIYCTGINSSFRGTGRPAQAVMRATSPDLRAWEKDSDFIFFAAAERGYELDDWRDPHVFWNEEAGEYWMLLAARRNTGPKGKRGCTGLAASPDLRTWEARQPFWAPGEYYCHPCPDIFRMGDWWYQVFSTSLEGIATHYRMSRSLEGPWIAPASDTFDGSVYCAAKTASDGERRYAFGWLPTTEGETDTGKWQWGGNLVVHELEQQADGALTVRMPDNVVAPFTEPIPLQPRPVLGEWSCDGSAFGTRSISGYSAISLGAMPDECLIEGTITSAKGTRNCGFLLRADGSQDTFYQVRLEPAYNRIVMDRWPHLGSSATFNRSFMIENRFLMDADAAIPFHILVDGTCVVVYAGDQVALSCRVYDYERGNVGLFVTEGEARFERVKMSRRP